MGVLGQISKHRNKFLNLVLLVIALIVAYKIYVNQMNTINSLNLQKEDLAKKNQALGEISDYEQKIRSLKDSVNKKDVSLAIKTIGKIAQENSVQIISIRPRTRESYPLYAKHSFMLQVAVNQYNDLGMFISALENHPDVYSLETIEIKPQPVTDKEPKHSRLVADLLVSTILFN